MLVTVVLLGALLVSCGDSKEVASLKVDCARILANLKSIEKQLRQLDFLVNAKFPFLQIFVILKEDGITELVDFTGKIACCKTKDFEKYANDFPVMYVLRPDKYIGLKQEQIDLKSLEHYLNQTLGF